MKLVKSLFYSLAMLLILQGCNTADKEDVTSPPENTPAENAKEAPNDPLFSFTNFDLEIDYGTNQKFDVDYENERDGMEAEIVDTVNNEQVKGDEAFEKLQPIFEGFTFDQNTSEDEVIDEVLKAFGKNNDFTRFDLDITFTDGTEKEYKKIM